METPAAVTPTHAELVAADIEEDRELVERILFLRSLTTSSKEVEHMMEALIVVTGHWQPARALSIRDRGALDELEAKLKEYILTRDPARAFTPQSLEQRLRERAKAPKAQPARHGNRIWVLLYASVTLLVVLLILYILMLAR